MRSAFESGNLIEYIKYKNNEASVKVTMLPNKCFQIRKFNKGMNYWNLSFETSSICTWDEVRKLIKLLLSD